MAKSASFMLGSGGFTEFFHVSSLISDGCSMPFPCLSLLFHGFPSRLRRIVAIDPSSHPGRSERLIFAPSSSLRPLFCVCEALSEPARSMSESLPTVSSRRSTRTWKTAWERLLVTFMAVGSVVRRWLPSTRSFSTSLAHFAQHSVTPVSEGPGKGGWRWRHLEAFGRF